jgi:(1->4)-alpha-D-glucan 1-alpha-D-glucosylmutase
LRIDHIDGLYDPKQYLTRLRARLLDLYIVVEKILSPGEELPLSWPVQGTTGYDFLHYVNGIFCRKEHEKKFTRLYSNFIRSRLVYKDLVSDKKRLIMEHMAGDIGSLAHLLRRSQAETGLEVILPCTVSRGPSSK